MTETAASPTGSSSPSSPSSSSGTASSSSAGSDDEPPRNRRSQLAAALSRHTPLLPPLVHIALSYLAADRLAILDGHSIKLVPLTPASTAAAEKPAADTATTLIPLRSAVSIMHLHLDGRICTTGVKDKLVRLYATLPPSFPPASPAASVLHLRHERHSPSVSSFHSLDARRLLVGFDDGSLHCYNTRSGAKICGMTLDCGIVALLPTTAAYAAIAHSSSMLAPAVTAASTTASSVAACATHVIAYTTDHAFRLIDVQLCRVAKYIGRIGYVSRAYALDGGGGRVAACGQQSVFVWRLYTWTCERTVNRDEEVQAERQWAELHCGTTSHEERKDGGSSEWECKEAALSQPIPPPRCPTSVCALWSSGFVACASSSGFVHAWRVGVQWSQRLLCSFRAHGPGLVSVRYVGAGRLVTAGGDGRVRVWQLRAGCGEKGCGEGMGRGLGCGIEEKLEDADYWRVHMLVAHDVLQDSRVRNGAVLFLPGD